MLVLSLLESGDKYGYQTVSYTNLSLGISPSTVRHQKFTFREKAKQAKLYLALYEQAFEAGQGKDDLMPLPAHATMVDDRYSITQEEKEKILETVFESLSPMKLKVFPSKEKRKIVVPVSYTHLLFSLMDLIYVILQDIWIFPKILNGYEAYRKTTPFLVPNYRSISRCFQTMRQERKSRNEI